MDLFFFPPPLPFLVDRVRAIGKDQEQARAGGQLGKQKESKRGGAQRQRPSPPSARGLRPLPMGSEPIFSDHRLDQ